MLNAFVWTESEFAVISFISICIATSLNILTITNCVKAATENFHVPLRNIKNRWEQSFFNYPESTLEIANTSFQKLEILLNLFPSFIRATS